MGDFDLDAELQGTAATVAKIAHDIGSSQEHKARLRQMLFHRHHELSVEKSAHPLKFFRRRMTALPRMALAAPPALGAAALLGVVVWALQISGAQSPQAAEAARITKALVRTVPTVTGWQVTMHQEFANSTSSYECSVPLQRGQSLYIRGSSTYLHSYGAWYRIPTTRRGARCSSSWEWSFVTLPSRLAQRSFAIVAGPRIEGRQTEGIRYRLHGPNNQQIQATAWVDVKSGLVLRLQRTVLRGSQLLERDAADYTYETSR